MLEKCDSYEPFDLQWDFLQAKRDTIIAVDVPAIIAPLSLERESFIRVAGDPFAHLTNESLALMFALIRLCSGHLFAVATSHTTRQRDLLRDWKFRGEVSNATIALLEHPLSRELLGEHRRNFVYQWTKPNETSIPWPPMNYFAGAAIGGQETEKLIPHLSQTPAALRWIKLQAASTPAQWYSHATATVFVPKSVNDDFSEIESVETFQQKIDWIYGLDLKASAAAYHARQAIEAGTPIYFSRIFTNPQIKSWAADLKLRQIPAVDARYYSIIRRIMQRVEGAASAQWDSWEMTREDIEAQREQQALNKPTSERRAADDFKNVTPLPPHKNFPPHLQGPAIATRTVHHLPAVGETVPLLQSNGQPGNGAYLGWATKDELSLEGEEMAGPTTDFVEIPVGERSGMSGIGEKGPCAVNPDCPDCRE